MLSARISSVANDKLGEGVEPLKRLMIDGMVIVKLNVEIEYLICC